MSDPTHVEYQVVRQNYPVSSDTGLKRLSRMNVGNMKVSHAGKCFLQCAFSPPDFAQVAVEGIPDDYQSQSLVKKHRSVHTVQLTADRDVYILLLPVPGFTHFTASRDKGKPISASDVFIGTQYSDYVQMFGRTVEDGADRTVSKFRFISNHIEIIPTVNSMSWTGSIQCWKLPITVSVRPGGEGEVLTIGGLEGVNSEIANQYTGPFINGLYSACYSSNCIFDFTNIMNNLIKIPQVLAIDKGDFASIWSPVADPPRTIPGFDNGFESLVIKISGVTAAESFILKTWACVEYQAVPDNIVYEFSSLSPHDPLAIELYRKVINELPVGVPYVQNESFWQRVLGIIRGITGTLSVIPGPIGMISAGVNQIVS